MDGLRLSALALHAVGDRDRTWLLSQLPEAQRKSLSELVEELRATGIPADPELVHQIVREREVLAASSEPEALGTRLVRASADDVWAQLRAESDAVIGRIVRRHDWPWKSAFLGLCGPARAKRIEMLMGLLAPAAALEKALVLELDQRLGLRQSTPARAQAARWQFKRRAWRSE